MWQRFAVLFVLASPLLLAGPASAQNELDAFMGAYVGTGIAERGGADAEKRDLDVTIEPYKNTGFTVRWITVMLGPEGERAGPDVRRRALEDNFVPSEDLEDVYVLAPTGGLFTRAEVPNPLKGEPMRWASVQDNTLTVYSLGISSTDGTELQIYHRTLTESGMDINFLRMQDENVELRVHGSLIRTE